MPRTWVDRIVERPRTFTFQNNADGSVTLIPAPGAVSQAGTPVNAANLNGIEADLVDYTKMVPYGGTTTGIANVYAIATPTITTLAAGMAVSVKINVNSTGASTLNWNAKGAKTIKKANGTNVTNLKAGGIYTLRYDGVNFILQGEGGSGNALASELLSGKTASTDAEDIVGTMPNYSSVEVSSIVNAYMYNGKAYLRPPEGYYNGGNLSNVFSTQPDILAANILSGKTIFGVEGGIANFTGLNKEATGYWNNGTTLYFPIKDAGYYSGSGTSGVYYASPDFVASNIARDKSIFGVAGTNTNKKWASGTTNPFFTNGYVIEVSGLSFRPSVVIGYKTYHGGFSSNIVLYVEKISTTEVMNASSYTKLITDGGGYISDSGFRLYCGQSTGTYYWIAIE